MHQGSASSIMLRRRLGYDDVYVNSEFSAVVSHCKVSTIGSHCHKCRMTYIYHYSVIQSIFSALKILCALSVHHLLSPNP